MLMVCAVTALGGAGVAHAGVGHAHCVGAACARATASACHRPGSRLLAQTRRARIFSVAGRGGGEYEAAFTVYGCLRARKHSVRLQHFGEGTLLDASLLRVTGRYAAFKETITDEVCDKYQPGPQCTSTQLVSFDLRTGHRRVLASGADPARLVLVRRGWIAWFEAATDDAPARVIAVDSLGRRTVDSGAIAPASLRAKGNVVSWRHDGETRTARLT
jgi:hypothetical protein